MVTLISPEGREVILHDREGGLFATDDLRTTYTSREDTGLTSLIGAQAQGDWVLTAGGLFSM